MSFALTDEQQMIREAAQAFLSERCDSQALRAMLELEAGYDPQLWQAIGQELGWCGIAIDEADGGLGLGPVELMLVQEQAGYRLLPSPFFATVCLAASLLPLVDEPARSSLAAEIAAGQRRLSTALPSRSALDTDLPQARQQGDQWLLDGEVARVPDLAMAQALLLLARQPDGRLGLFLVEVAACQPQALAVWDSSRRFAQLRCDAVPAQPLGLDVDAAALVPVADQMRLYIAAEQLGAAQRCLDLTVDYVAERKQFGRAVGSFQAVKHRCAEMMLACESTRSAVYGAAAMMAAAQDAGQTAMEVASARALATESLHFCAAEAIQLHGGVGFTWEYDPQLYFKRARASQHWLGDPASLRAQIAECLIGAVA